MVFADPRYYLHINKTLIVLHEHTNCHVWPTCSSFLFRLMIAFNHFIILANIFGEIARAQTLLVLCLPNEVGSQWIRKLHVAVNSKKAIKPQ